MGPLALESMMVSPPGYILFLTKLTDFILLLHNDWRDTEEADKLC